jgi:hypothetical protein
MRVMVKIPRRTDTERKHTRRYISKVKWTNAIETEG